MKKEIKKLFFNNSNNLEMIPLPLVFVCLLIRLTHEEGRENLILPIFPFHLATERFLMYRLCDLFEKKMRK